MQVRWQKERDMRPQSMRTCACCDTHSLMTGAVRFTEQLWLLTDCGRWAGLSKAATVTFNLPNPHANTHTHTQKYSHQWHCNIFFLLHTLHVWLLSCLLGAGMSPWGNRSGASDQTDLLLPGDSFSSPEWIHTPSGGAAADPSHTGQAQAGSCRACFNDFLLLPPPPAFRCGCHLKTSCGEKRGGLQISASVVCTCTDRGW